MAEPVAVSRQVMAHVRVADIVFECRGQTKVVAKVARNGAREAARVLPSLIGIARSGRGPQPRGCADRP